MSNKNSTLGNYVKKISTSTNGFEKLHLILNNAQDRNEIKAKMTLKGNIHLSESLDSNLCMLSNENYYNNVINYYQFYQTNSNLA